MVGRDRGSGNSWTIGCICIIELHDWLHRYNRAAHAPILLHMTLVNFHSHAVGGTLQASTANCASAPVPLVHNKMGLLTPYEEPKERLCALQFSNRKQWIYPSLRPARKPMPLSQFRPGVININLANKQKTVL